jgi:hypothetical protein
VLKPIHLDIVCFGDDSPVEIERSKRAILKALFFLTRLNRDFFLTYPDTPKLYQSGVVYLAETDHEIWQDVPATLRRGTGDCEDLACYRCGELQAEASLCGDRGPQPWPYISWRKADDSDPDASMIYHCLVRHPNGLIEDPSEALGMNGQYTSAPVFIGKDDTDL